MMVCPCCVSPEPCPPCLQCEWPADTQETVTADYTDCFGVQPQSRARQFTKQPTINGLEVLRWLPQYLPSGPPLSNCMWTFVIDYSETAGCCEIPPEFGGLKIGARWKWRVRMLLVTACPEDGEPTVEDVTELYVDAEESELEGERRPLELPAFPECVEPPGYADYLEFFADPGSWITCNPLP